MLILRGFFCSSKFCEEFLRSSYHQNNDFESLIFQAAVVCNFKVSFVLGIHSETLKITSLTCKVMETLEVVSETQAMLELHVLPFFDIFLLLLIFVSKIFSSDTTGPIETLLCMNVLWCIMNRTDVGIFDPWTNMATVTKNRT